jgi:predicted nucleic acid-binding protein
MSIFVDTGAWFASVISSDPYHLKIMAFLQQNTLPLITTDYIVDETLTLLRARGEFAKSVALGQQLVDAHIANLITVTPQIFDKAWHVFRGQPTRKWSFTDCTSKVVIDEFHVKRALAQDNHFREFGAVDAMVG